MSRLTKKIDMCEGKGSLYQPPSIQEYSTKNKHSAINKLGQLEDIEEKYGIDLITLFKAFECGFWSKGGYYEECCIENEPIFIPPERVRLGKTFYEETKHKDDNEYSIDESEVLCLFDMNYEDEVYVVRVKDYGRTWALTREELGK